MSPQDGLEDGKKLWLAKGRFSFQYLKKHPKLRKEATHRAEHGEGLGLAPLQLVATSQTFSSCRCSS